jgi:hypothetical protein
MFFYNDQRKCIPDCPRSLEASKILLELAAEMRVNLRQVKPLEIPGHFRAMRHGRKPIILAVKLL